MANNLKGLDANQVLRSVFDVQKNTLRVSIVDGSTGDGGGAFEVVISHLNDSIRLGNGSAYITTTNITSKVALDTSVVNVVDIEDLDSSKDNVAIRDSDGHELNVNSDGSINTNETLNPNLETKSIYNEVSSVASSTEALIVSHTAVSGKRTFLQKAACSGDNIAKYRVKIDGTTIDLKRTMFGQDLNVEFNFEGKSINGLEVAPGSVVTVTTTHERSNVGDFNGRIQLIEVTWVI